MHTLTADNPSSKAAADKSWHSRDGYKPSIAWLRMRERYRPRNLATGAALVAFIAGACNLPPQQSLTRILTRLFTHFFACTYLVRN